MIKVNILDGSGEKHTTKVTHNNELLVVKQFSQAEKITLTVDNTPVNLIKPKAGSRLIITGLIVNTDRNVGVNGASVEVYEANSESSSTVDKAILTFDLAKNQTVATSSILIETTEGVFINAKADDSNVNVTLLSYFALIANV